MYDVRVYLVAAIAASVLAGVIGVLLNTWLVARRNDGRPWYKSRIAYACIGIVVTIALVMIVWYAYTYYSTAPDLSISVDPMQGSTSQGNVIQTEVAVKSIHGYDYPVSLSASGQPSDLAVAFTPSITRPAPVCVSTATISVASNVPVGDYTVIIKGTGADGTERTCTYALTVKRALTPSKVLNVLDVFYPSGFGDAEDIELDESSVDNPRSGIECIKITYSAAQSRGKGWAGIYWLNPGENWGDRIEGQHLTGATRLTFWARGKRGGEKAEFKVGGITGRYPDSIQPSISTSVVVLSDKWQKYTIDLTGKDLSHVIGGFCWVTDKEQNPRGCTIYLDDIHYEFY